MIGEECDLGCNIVCLILAMKLIRVCDNWSVLLVVHKGFWKQVFLFVTSNCCCYLSFDRYFFLEIKKQVIIGLHRRPAPAA